MAGDEIEIESGPGTTIGKVEGQGNLVGTGNISVSGGTLVMLNMTQADEHGVARLQQLAQAPNIAPEAALGAVKNAPTRQEMAPLVDALLEALQQHGGNRIESNNIS